MRLSLILLFLFSALSSATADDEVMCRPVDDMTAFVASFETASCSMAKTLQSTYCETCPNFAELKAAAVKGSQEDCFKWLEKVACTRSPWKDLKTIAKRYQRFMALAAEAKSKFPREALACIAVRETMVLDPVSTSCVGGRKKPSDPKAAKEWAKKGYAGLGHMDFEAFSATLSDSSPEGILKEDWLKPYSCQTPKLSLRQIFNEKYTRDPAFQIAAMAKVLESKGATLSSALLKYNGSPKYVIAVKACTTCLQGGGDPLKCLDKAAAGKFPPGGKVCD